jgi:hypothetical protein
MRKLKFALGAAAVLVVVLLTTAWYMEMFRGIEVHEGPRGPFTFVYRETRSAGFAEVGIITTTLDSMLLQRGISTRQPMDIFFPDGRAEIGFAIGNGSLLPPSDGLTHIRVIPSRTYMETTFPWKNRLSYIAGYIKVTHAFDEYRNLHAYGSAEAMTVHLGDSIEYLQPVVH